jgi:hypothetical protein
MYVYIGHYKIPIVKEELPKISKYNVFIDLNMSNSFHQLRLGPITLSRLSIQTPWGQVEPKFMPEGVGPASFHLQSVVSSVSSAQLEDSDDEEGYGEQLIRYAHDLELDERDTSTGKVEEAGCTWSKLSPKELELEQQSSVSVMKSQFQKPKQQDKDTLNGCFHLLLY